MDFAVVKFTDGVQKVAAVSLIRHIESKKPFRPVASRDTKGDFEVKWQASDIHADGFWPAEVLLIAGKFTTKNISLTIPNLE